MGDREARTHHIGRILHHFVPARQRDTGRLAPVTATRQAGGFRFAVAGVGDVGLTAAAAAHLALVSVPAMAGPVPSACSFRVTLWDEPGVQEAAVSHLEPMLAVTSGGAHSHSIRFERTSSSSGQLLSAGSGDGAPDRSAMRIAWHHLGAVTDDGLGRLQRLRFDSGDAIARVPEFNGLVWCLRMAQTPSFRVAYYLGRMIQICEPAQVKILLSDDAPVQDGGSRRREGDDAHARAADLCRELTHIVAPGCPVEILASSPAGSGEDLDVRETFMRTAGSMIMGASARRRAGPSANRMGEASA